METFFKARYLLTYFADFLIFAEMVRQDFNPIHHIFNFGCGPTIFRKVFLPNNRTICGLSEQSFRFQSQTLEVLFENDANSVLT